MSTTTKSLSPGLEKAWARFQQTVDEMRVKMEQTPRYRDNPQNRAKAYHTLAEAQAMAYNFAVAPRMRHPRIQINTGWQTHFYTLGQNGMDFFYGVMFLDGRQSYRLSGRMGDIELFLLQVISHLPGHPDSKTIGNYDFEEYGIHEGQDFELIMSAKPHDANWIPLDATSPYQFILMRRTMRDWNDDPGELRIEMIDPPADDFYDRDEFDEAAVAERIDRATAYFRYMIEHWNINLYDMYLEAGGGVKNSMGLLPGVITSEVGNPMSNYAMGIFELEHDEALILTMDDVPDSAYWSFQLGDVWSRSLDFRNYQTDIGMAHAAIDADGVFRAVISRKDPGIANWLDTRGRREGTVVFRNYRSPTEVVPKVRKASFADVASHLPKDTRTVTPAERAEALRLRRQGFLKLHGE